MTNGLPSAKLALWLKSLVTLLSIARSTALGMAWSFFGGFVIVYNEFKNDFMGRLELYFRSIDCEFGGGSALSFPLLLSSVVTTFLITCSSGIDVFFFTSAIQCREIWNNQTFGWKSTFVSGVKCILGQHAVWIYQAQCESIMRLWDIFHDSQQSYLKWGSVLANAFH